MITNTDMTLYHKTLDENTRLEKWVRFYIENVWWYGGKGVSTQKGYENANDVQVRIPYGSNYIFNVDNSMIEQNIKGNMLTGKLTIKLSDDKSSDYTLDITKFEVGDIIVKGKINQDIISQSDLSNYKDVYNITAISNNTFGNNQHIHLGGK